MKRRPQSPANALEDYRTPDRLLLDNGSGALYFSRMQFFYYLFGAITIAAAVQGALAGSPISLVAGGILGALIVAGGYLWNSNVPLGMILALVGSIGIAGRFVPAFLKKGYVIWPAGTLALLSVVGVVLAIVALATRK
jgi:uncharacterized membrane protein (UPF0136 family)